MSGGNDYRKYRKPVDYIIALVALILVFCLPLTNNPILSSGWGILGVVAVFWITMITLTHQRKEKDQLK